MVSYCECPPSVISSYFRLSFLPVRRPGGRYGRHTQCVRTWTLTDRIPTQVTATNARGASTALVGSPQTIADSILDYVDLGCELISIRGYDNYNDAVDYGRYILPRVREELAKRESEKGTNGSKAA